MKMKGPDREPQKIRSDQEVMTFLLAGILNWSLCCLKNVSGCFNLTLSYVLTEKSTDTILIAIILKSSAGSSWMSFSIFCLHPGWAAPPSQGPDTPVGDWWWPWCSLFSFSFFSLKTAPSPVWSCPSSGLSAPAAFLPAASSLMDLLIWSSWDGR